MLHMLDSKNDYYEQIINVHSQSVYRFCRSLTYSKEDAEDLFQETFVQAFEKSVDLMNRDNPQGYLCSIALYTWKSWKRKYARRKRLAPSVQLDETITSEMNVEEALLIQEENRVVRELVDKLQDKFKIPLILYYSLEMRVTDIAAMLKLPVGTVKSRLFKGRQLIEKGLVAINYE